MRFDISQSLNGDQIVFIARDANGVVRLRAKSIEELQEQIKAYNPTIKEAPKKEPEVKVHEEEANSTKVLEEILEKDTPEPASDSEELASLLSGNPKPSEDTTEIKKEFLKSDLKEKVEEKKKRTSKGSFWDKLK